MNNNSDFFSMTDIHSFFPKFHAKTAHVHNFFISMILDNQILYHIFKTFQFENDKFFLY
jgi:hypothetical protein